MSDAAVPSHDPAARGPSSTVGDLVRLTVPAEDDFVALVRLTVQAIAARSGCLDDARSRLRAAVGSAFFDLVHELGGEGSVRVELRVDPQRVVVDLAGVGGAGELVDARRRTVHVEVEHPPLPAD